MAVFLDKDHFIGNRDWLININIIRKMCIIHQIRNQVTGSPPPTPPSPDIGGELCPGVGERHRMVRGVLTDIFIIIITIIIHIMITIPRRELKVP